MSVIDRLRDGLIVSCQALENEPLHGNRIMAAMARAAEEGGAKAIRSNGPDDIRAIKKEVFLPVIGIYKNTEYDSDIYITPTLKEAGAIVKAGADILAVDATGRERPDGRTVEEYAAALKNKFRIPLMADVSTLQEGLRAEKAGYDLVSTTLSGYTDYSRDLEGPDFELLEELVTSLELPVILEGRVSTPEEARKGFEIGAYAVVVGTAITRPQVVTSRFVKAINEDSKI